VPFVSDFFDFSIFLDADEDAAARLVHRALHAAEGKRAFRDPAPLIFMLTPASPTRRGGKEIAAGPLGSGSTSSIYAEKHPAGPGPRARPHPEQGAGPRDQDVALRRL